MFGDCVLALNYSLLGSSLFVSSSFPSDPPGWLVCCCATSAHSLQEMTDADEGQKTPFDALRTICARVAHLSFRWLLMQH